MAHFLDNLIPTVERIEDAPAAFEATLRGMMAWLRNTTREANVHAFVDSVEARIPELVGANVANTASAPKEDKDAGGDEKPADEGAVEKPAEAGPASDTVEGGKGSVVDAPHDDEANPTGSEAVVVPDESRRERPSANEVMTGAPAAATQDTTPLDAVTPNTAPAQGGFAGFSQHADDPSVPFAPAKT